MKRVLIGEGGSSFVYRVWDEKRQIYVAEKESDYPLVWEAIWLQKLQDFAVPDFYELKSNDGKWILSMEYLPGKTLLQILKENHGDMLRYFDISRHVILEILKIRDAFPDFVFCDLKPSNIIVDWKNQIRFIDLGSVSTAGVQKCCQGTMPYTAPEVAAGQPSLKSDIYSMAQILWQMRNWEKDLFFYRVIEPCIRKEVVKRQGDLHWLYKKINHYFWRNYCYHKIKMMRKKIIYIGIVILLLYSFRKI